MDILRQLIQTIVVIVILAVFLEMMLPRGDMARYAKMVMGLLIILAVLQTVTGVINRDLFRDIPDVTESAPRSEPVALEDIMAAGKSLSEANRREAQDRYSEGIARQVMSLAGLSEGLQVTGARVWLEDDSGAIGKIVITCGTAGEAMPQPMADEGAKTVQPVTVSVGDYEDTGGGRARPTETDVQTAARMAGMVADFYNLRREQVEIKFE